MLQNSAVIKNIVSNPPPPIRYSGHKINQAKGKIRKCKTSEQILIYLYYKSLN